MNRFIILIFSVTILGCNSTKKQEAQSFKKYTTTIDSLMQYSFEKGIFNGNILVTRNDSLVYQKSFGYTDGTVKNKLTKESIFNPGSIAKEFVAVSILMLVEKGELSLNDNLSKFDLGLPDWSTKVTIKHLLNYVAGLPQIDYANVKNDDDILEDLQQLPGLLFEPGTNYNYNNNSIFLQKIIIESVTKNTFKAFVNKYITTPLKMNHSAFDIDFDYPNRTRSFNVHKENAREFYPSTGWLWVTIDDLNKWITALRHNTLITDASFKTISVNQFFQEKGSILGSYDAKKALHLHGGQSYQFEAAFMSELKDDLSILLMSNNKNQSFNIIQSVHNIMKGKLFSLPKKSIYRQIRRACHKNIDEGIKLYHTLKQNDYELYNFGDPNALNSLGYDLLSKKKINESIIIFKLAISEFPKDANLYDSLGEAYYTQKQYSLALENYKKSLELNAKNTNAEKMIKKIKALAK
ncbi:serine hydrolase [Tenacibaculum sp. 190524A02b]|uniref:serine hydrolase n=1 Tax=Tenacibaculum vairaonense TaxID=3137860 RepID=UPI0031FB9652